MFPFCHFDVHHRVFPFCPFFPFPFLPLASASLLDPCVPLVCALSKVSLSTHPSRTATRCVTVLLC
jgi:hypothetical protein